MAAEQKDWQTANPGCPQGEGGGKMVARMNESHRPLRDWAFKFLTFWKGMHILDVGCGGGAAIADLLKLSPESIVEGVDYSSDCVHFTEDYNREFIGSRVFVRQGDVSSLPYEANSFDLVTAVETVYFWPDLKAGLAQILRVLRAGGQMAILCEVDGPERMNWEKVNFELTVYRPAELADALQAVGFADVSVQVRGDGYLAVFASKPGK